VGEDGRAMVARQSRAPGWLLAACLLAGLCGCAVAVADDGGPSGAYDAIRQAMPDWEVVRADAEPTVQADGALGYRIALRRGRPEGGPQQQMERRERPRLPGAPGTHMVYSHTEIVLASGNLERPEQVLRKIAWGQYEQEYYVRPTWMGRGLGFTWFCNAQIFWQDCLRTKVGLAGGEDRLEVIAEGLGIEDKGNCTANTSIGLVGRIGAPALPYVKRAIERNMATDPSHAVVSLAGIHEDECTQFLIELYQSGDQRVTDAAGYALIHKPYREAAKNVYFDLLRRQKHTRYACEACLQFGWKDSMPVLEQVIAAPRTWYDYRAAFEAARSLRGQPMPEDLVSAERVIEASAFRDSRATADEIGAAKAAILANADKSAAAVIGVSLALFLTKGDTRHVAAIGRDILGALPREVVRPLLACVTDHIPVENQGGGPELRALRKTLDAEAIGGPGPPPPPGERDP